MSDDLKVKFEHVEPLSIDEKPSVNELGNKQIGEADMQKMLEDTVRRVREQSDRLQAAARPYADRTRTLAESRPVLFTYLSIFAILSFIPVCCFVGFIVSSTLFVVGAAAIGICLTVLFTILLASAFLLPTLFFTSFVALTALLFLLSIFLMHRLYVHLSASTTTTDGALKADYNNLSRGVRSWVDETAGRLPDYSFDFSALQLGGSSGVKGVDGQATPKQVAPGVSATDVNESPNQGDVGKKLD